MEKISSTARPMGLSCATKSEPRPTPEVLRGFAKPWGWPRTLILQDHSPFLPALLGTPQKGGAYVGWGELKFRFVKFIQKELATTKSVVAFCNQVK